MPLYNFLADSGQIETVPEATFKETKLKERADLQRLLRDHIEVLDKDIMVLSEEFGDWEESSRRIDLLALDKEASLVVIELKRDDSAHMELQAIRYAAMISAMTFESAVLAHEKYLSALGRHEEAEAARERILDFLGWDASAESQFAQRVRIVLASSAFSKELTTTALWLRDQYGLDIRCVKMVPHLFNGATLVGVDQIIPLPEASEFQTKLRKKTALAEAEKKSGRDLTKYNVKLGDDDYEGLPKRQAVFEIIRYLCKVGVTPDDIANHCERTPWLIFDGDLNAKQFEAAVLQKFEPEGSGPDRLTRYFLGDEHLIRWQGRTYALTRMWGGPKFTKTLDNLRKAYPNKFEFSPAE